jgi:MFS family permease
MTDKPDKPQSSDDLDGLKRKPSTGGRVRNYSEGGGAFESQRSLNRRGSQRGSRGSQLNMMRKNSVVGAVSIVPDINPDLTIDDSSDEQEESLNDNHIQLDDLRGNKEALLSKGDEEPLEEEMSEEEQKKQDKIESRKYFKNLIVLCIGFFFIFTAFLSLRNLQSSINAVAGLGMYALSCTYALFFVGCIFATTIVQRLGPKKAILVLTIGPLMYDFAYFYPQFYTMVPAAGLAGFAQGVIWTAHATYIANIAACYANLTGEKIQNVLSKFNGIFFVFYQSCQIIGGIIASLILKSPEPKSPDMVMINGTFYNCTHGYFESFNTSLYDFHSACNSSYSPQTKSYEMCGRNYCHFKAVKSEAPVDRTLVYILVGVFTGCTITGILVLLFFLDPLDGQMKMKKAQGKLHHQLFAVFRFYGNKKAICMVGVMFYSLLQAAFMFGEYNKAFVTCTIGIQNVGFIMMALSFSSANAAFWNGRIQKYTGRMPLLATAFLCQGAVFITLFFWTPSPENMPVFFILVIIWGVGDGTIMTQDISIIGFLFASNKEPAFAALKMTQSIANFTFFIAGPYMCTLHKIFYVGTILILATTGYFSLELILHIEARNDAKKAVEAGSMKTEQAESNNHDPEKKLALT